MSERLFSKESLVGNRMSRRRFLGFVAVACAGGALAACTPQTAPTAAPSEPEVKEAPPTVKPESSAGKATIEMWMWETEERWQRLQDASGLTEEFPDVDFKWTALPYGDLHQKALTSMAAGLAEGMPSIVRTGAGYYRPFANSGGIMDVTEYVAPYEKDVLDYYWAESIIDGRIYQFPDDTGVMMFGYRWDIFEQAGLPSEPDEVLDLLATYDDLIEVGQTIKDATGALMFNMTPSAGTFTNIGLQDTTGFFDAEGDVIFDSDKHVHVAEVVKMLFNSGLVTRYDQGPQIVQAYKDDQLVFDFYPNWEDFTILDNFPETAGKWRVTRLPATMPGGKRGTVQNGCLLVIPAAKPAEERDLAARVATYMKFTEKASVAHMKEFSGAFVSYVPGLEAMHDYPSPVLDGQSVYTEFLKTAQEEEILPWYRSSTVFFNEAYSAAGEAMFKILDQGAAIGESLKEAADTVRAMQDEKGIK